MFFLTFQDYGRGGTASLASPDGTSLLIDMGAIRWGTQGTCSLHFSDGVDMMYHAPHLFLVTFFIWRSFKNKSDVCHVLCEELFMLDITHSQVDVETEFGVVSLNLMFFLF